MDELYDKFTDESYTLWENPLVSVTQYLVYINMHVVLSKITPQFIPSYRTYCQDIQVKVSQLVLRFSKWFIEKRTSVISHKNPDYSKIGGVWKTWFFNLGYCYAKGTFCGGPHFHLIDDPFDLDFR